jgi:hypothetical protein
MMRVSCIVAAVGFTMAGTSVQAAPHGGGGAGHAAPGHVGPTFNGPTSVRIGGTQFGHANGFSSVPTSSRVTSFSGERTTTLSNGATRSTSVAGTRSTTLSGTAPVSARTTNLDATRTTTVTGANGATATRTTTVDRTRVATRVPFAPNNRFYVGGYGAAFGTGFGVGVGYGYGGYGYPGYGYGGYLAYGYPAYGVAYGDPLATGVPVAVAPIPADPLVPAAQAVAQPPTDAGLKIVDVLDNSAAKNADLRPGDIILGVGMTRTQSFEELRQAISAAQGQQVDIIFLNAETGKVERLPLTAADGKLGVSVQAIDLK